MKKTIYLLLFILLISSVSALTPPTGGVYYWNFSSVTDLWGSTDLTNSGATSNNTHYATFGTSGDSSPTSYEYDGNTDYQTAPNTAYDFTTSNNYSFSFWARADSWDNTWDATRTAFILFDTRDDSDIFIGWFKDEGDTNDKKIFSSQDDGGGQERIHTSVLSLNTWYHVVYTYDEINNYAHLWLDGNYVGNVSVGSPNAVSFGNNKIGDSHISETGFDGLIDEVKIYNITLNSSQISNLYEYGNITGVTGGTDTVITTSANKVNQVTNVTINAGTFTNVMNYDFNITSNNTPYIQTFSVQVNPAFTNTAECRVQIDGTTYETKARTNTANQIGNIYLQTEPLVLDNSTTHNALLQCRKTSTGNYVIFNTKGLGELLEDVNYVNNTFSNTTSSSTYQEIYTNTFTTNTTATTGDVEKHLILDFSGEVTNNALSTEDLGLIPQINSTNCSEIKRTVSSTGTGSVGGFCILKNVAENTSYDISFLANGSSATHEIVYTVKEIWLENHDLNSTKVNFTKTVETGWTKIDNVTVNSDDLATGNSLITRIGAEVTGTNGNAQFQIRLNSTNGTVFNRYVSSSKGNIVIQELFEGLTPDVYSVELWADVDSVSTIKGDLIAYPVSLETETANTFTVTAYNIYDNSSITTFNVTDVNNNLYQTTTGSVQIATNSLDNLTISATNYFNNITLNHNTSTDLNASLYAYTEIYAQDYSNSSAINTFKVQYTNNANSSETGIVSTTTGTAKIPLYDATYTVLIYDASQGSQSYSSQTQNLTANTYLENYTFSLYHTNTVNISFYYEDSLNLANDTTITVYIIDETNTSYNYSETDGNLFDSELNAGNYEIRYSASGFPERSYFFTLADQSYNEFSLYLANGTLTSEITNTLYDEVGTKLEGYYIKLLRYYPTTNNYLTVEQCLTNFAGICVLNAEVSDEDTSVYYKFRITGTDGTIYKTTSATKIYDTTLTHFIVLGEGIGEDLDTLSSISYSLTYLPASDQFKFTWNDAEGTLTDATLEVYKVNPQGNTLEQSTVTSSSSGTVYITATDDNQSSYIAKAYVGDTLADTLSIDYLDIIETFGVFGVFLTLIIVLTMVLLGINNPAIAVILLPVSLILTKIAGINAMRGDVLTGITAIAIIIIYVISNKT